METKIAATISIIFLTSFINPANSSEQSSPASDNSFTFAVMADPQAFRLMRGGDPNSESTNGSEWRRITNNLVSSLNATPNISFGIINGDMTEFGRSASWLDVFSSYRNLKFPYFYGLGNHDYSNNVGDCFDGDWLSIDGCAMRSVHNMESHISTNKTNYKLDNFYSDWNDNKGSLAYSWDYEGVHFVQLQNHPNYHVQLHNAVGKMNYNIIPSLTWLANDLRKAKLRGVKDIILNFHDYHDDFTSSANSYARLQFQAIMLTYKPLAVFAGHNHAFYRDTHNNDSFYGNTTVYRTGAAFDAKFHLVTYDNGNLTVKEMDGLTGKAIESKKYTETRQTPNPICKLQGSSGAAGTIYMSTFIPQGAKWNLRQILRSGNNVDANSAGHAYMRHWNEANPYQIWAIEKAYGDDWPEFNSWYIIKQLQTGRVLDSNANGEVYTNVHVAGNGYQQWWPIKTERGELLFVNRSTNRVLDGDGSELYTTAGIEAFNQYKIWQVSHGWDRTQPENIRYFKARANDSWRYKLPQGTTSNNYWEYLSSHNFLYASPCIGW